jgi:hypothetical protein
LLPPFPPHVSALAAPLLPSFFSSSLSSRREEEEGRRRREKGGGRMAGEEGGGGRTRKERGGQEGGLGGIAFSDGFFMVGEELQASGAGDHATGLALVY